MNYALGEIESLSRKATRGAGYSWGLAEDAGRAVRWLTARGLAGLPALAGLLEAGLCDNGPDVNWDCNGVLCPIRTGAALADFAFTLSHERAIDLGPTAFPLLLVPFLAHKKQVDLSWNGAHIIISEDSVKITSALTAVQAEQARGVSVILSNKVKLASMRTMSRAIVTPDIYGRLDAFAKKTYAPATEASRLAGAGAGLSDND